MRTGAPMDTARDQSGPGRRVGRPSGNPKPWSCLSHAVLGCELIECDIGRLVWRHSAIILVPPLSGRQIQDAQAVDCMALRIHHAKPAVKSHMAARQFSDAVMHGAAAGFMEKRYAAFKLEWGGLAPPLRHVAHRAPASATRAHIAGSAPFVSQPMSEPCIMASTCSGVGDCSSLLLRQSGEHFVSAG